MPMKEYYGATEYGDKQMKEYVAAIRGEVPAAEKTGHDDYRRSAANAGVSASVLGLVSLVVGFVAAAAVSVPDVFPWLVWGCYATGLVAILLSCLAIANLLLEDIERHP